MPLKHPLRRIHANDRSVTLHLGPSGLPGKIPIYERLFQIAPEFAEGWNRRATVRYMRGDFNGSIADIEATLKLEPRHFGAIAGLGLCRIALEDLAGAANAFRDVLAINRKASGPKNNLEAIEQMLKGDAI